MDGEMVFAKKSDFEDIISLWSNCFGDDREYIEDYLARFFCEKRILLYKLKGVTVGMASVFELDDDGDDYVYIYALCVDEKYRGRGIATVLIEFIRNLFNRDIILQPEQNGVEKFYIKIGFERLSAEKLDLIMKKYGLEELTLGFFDGFIRKRI